MEYKEKLEEAKRLYESANADQKYVLESLFPELKESEDEKVRKTIIRFFKDNYPNETEMYDGSVTVGKVLDWLEKQGEQKQDANIQINPSEYINDMGGNGCYLKNATQVSAWSEEDEHRVKDTIYFLDTAKKHYASTVELDACIDWLETLKQRIGE